MLPELGISDEELKRLGEELGRCDFRADACRRFLDCTETCDVQAAPGSGKTTLLVAKLVALVRRWRDPTRGLCVISHTNVARREIEARVATSVASRLLSHPHFIGTVTSFVHGFLALPYLRGLGWTVRAIDDDVFAHRAKKRVRKNAFLRRQRQKADQFGRWAETLTLATDFRPTEKNVGTRVAIRAPAKMPASHTETHKAFQEIKADLLRDGYFRYADLTVLAAAALEACPTWAKHLAGRFPLVFVDEAQDTGSPHLALIKSIFAECCVQRIGDANQRIFENEVEASGWNPSDPVIDLGASRRFGARIAEFASRITVRRAQAIVGAAEDGPQPAVVAYSDGASTRVIPRFGELVADAFPTQDADAWAVASIHRRSTAATALSLCDYHPTYQAPRPPREKCDTAHGAFMLAAAKARDETCLAEPLAVCSRAVLEVLRRQRVAGFEGQLSHRSLWRRLEELAAGSADRVRAALCDWLLAATTTTPPPWEITRVKLVGALEPVIGSQPTLASREYLREAESTLQNDERSRARQLTVPVGDRVVTIRLGSIASVKGRTHDATLVVQTKLNQTRDVATALKVAAGIDGAPTDGTPIKLKAVTNVFVGSTRPRRLLCLAMPEADLSKKLRAAVTAWGWRIVTC